MRKYVGVFLILGFLMSAMPALAQKIGYVDFNKILNQSKIGKRYIGKMKSVASTYERKIKNVERKMMKIDKELRSSVVSKDVKVKKISELQKLQQQRIKLLQEYQKKKAQLERNLLLKIGKVIKEYAEKNKFDLILTGGLERGILFYSNRIDITRDVLNYVNKKLR